MKHVENHLQLLNKVVIIMGTFARNVEKLIRLDRSGAYSTKADRIQVTRQFSRWVETSYKRPPKLKNLKGKYIYPFLQDIADHGAGNGRICNVAGHLRRLLYLVDARWQMPVSNKELLMKIRTDPEGQSGGVRDRIGPDRRTDMAKVDLSLLNQLQTSMLIWLDTVVSGQKKRYFLRLGIMWLGVMWLREIKLLFKEVQKVAATERFMLIIKWLKC
jgi:hypothetical protein